MPATYSLRPASSEYSPYFGTYVRLVPDADVIDLLETQIEATLRLLSTLSEAEAGARYAPDKWSIKQAVGHMIDTERIFAYRALCISRNETIALPGFEQDDYVRAANFDHRSLRDLLDEFRAVRTATVLLFKSLTDAMMLRTGVASEATLSVRALAYIIAGHERHHGTIFRERYSLLDKSKATDEVNVKR